MFSQIKFYGGCAFALIILFFTWDYKRMKKTIEKQKAEIKGHKAKEEIAKGDDARELENRENEKEVKEKSNANLLEDANDSNSD